jgi:hypothetical protein
VDAPLYTSTSNHSATIHKSPQHSLSYLETAIYVFTNCSLATVSNSVDSSASLSQVLSAQPPHRAQLNFIPFLRYLATDHVETPCFHCFSPSVAFLRFCCLSTGTYLPNPCPDTAAVYRVTAQQLVYTSQYRLSRENSKICTNFCDSVRDNFTE